MSYRLVAIDLDGTALDPSGAIRPSVQRSIERVRARGVRVVIATGRRFRTGGPFAEQLGLTGASVFHHGALVKDVETGATRVRRELPGDLYRAAVAAVTVKSVLLVPGLTVAVAATPSTSALSTTSGELDGTPRTSMPLVA